MKKSKQLILISIIMMMGGHPPLAQDRFATDVEKTSPLAAGMNRAIQDANLQASTSTTQTQPEETLLASADNPASAGAPSGSYSYFNNTSCPTGWTLANGTNGTLDLRGEFIRGWDAGRGLDPASGRNVGSIQGGDLLAHSHSGRTDTGGKHRHPFHTAGRGSGSTTASNEGVTDQRTKYTYYSGSHSHTLSINSTGGAENRPRNVAMLACMKE